LQHCDYKGKLVALTNGCGAAKYLKDTMNAGLIRDKDNGFPLNSRRFFFYKEFLRGVTEPVIITDSRDVVFQSNPEENMPTEGVNVFLEHEGVTIGTCPYNAEWMDQIGQIRYGEKNIICAGVISGNLTELIELLWHCLSQYPPYIGLDQAILNHLIYSERIKSDVYKNEEGPVYTVGYIPLGTIPITDGVIRNKRGVPCVVHQYDRHHNLTEGLNDGRWTVR
jgi:hypothetical protein